MSCPDCHKGFILPGEPKGSMIGPNYFTPARGDSTQPTKAIILLTDVFGVPMANPKIVADHLAEHVGVDVWVPDLFDGGLHSNTLCFSRLTFDFLSVRQAPVCRGGSRTSHARSCWCQIEMDHYGRYRFQGPPLDSQNVRQPPLCCRP